ncbi:Mov34/MPN/PAD-1 family protein [Streptomyces phaeochromogenes]
MKSESLRISPRSLDAFIDDVRRHGRLGRETGGFFLTTPEDRDVRAVALAGSRGIDRAYGRFVIGLQAIDKAFAYAEERGLQVRAMLHSHPRGAFLSRTDLRHSLRVPGFVNAVVPTFAEPPTDPSLWGWWQYDDDWSSCAPPVTDPACPKAAVITFDAEGVREGHGY